MEDSLSNNVNDNNIPKTGDLESPFYNAFH